MTAKNFCPRDCVKLINNWPEEIVCLAYYPPINLSISGSDAVQCVPCPYRKDMQHVDTTYDSTEPEELY